MQDISVPAGAITTGHFDPSHSDNSPYNILRGDTYKDQRTIIVIATRGRTSQKRKLVCDCGKEHEYEYASYSGLDPAIVDSWERIIKPMNQPVIRLFAVGYEVGDAYNQMIRMILDHPQLKSFPYILFLEDDMIVPHVADSQGPLIELMRLMDRYDIAGALYWTKGTPSSPLILGYPNSENFEVVNDWKDGEIVECNGMGMGFTLMKRSIFEDPRVKDKDGNWFKTVNEVEGNNQIGFTQDLYFMKHAVIDCKYKACVHTGLRAGHMDMATGVVY